MPLSNQIKIFLVGALLVNYLLRTPGLMDEYYVGRFAWLSLLGLWACIGLFPKMQKVKGNVLDLLFLLFYLISLSSLTWASLPSAGYIGVQGILLSLVCYLAFRLFIPKIEERLLFRLLAALSLLVIAIASWQLLQVGLSQGLGGKNIYRVFGHSAHKNLLASFLFLLFGFNLIWALRKSSSQWMYWLLGAQLLIMILLRSRAVFLALFLFFLVVGIHLLRSNEKGWGLMAKRILPLLSGALIIGGLLFFFSGGTKEDLRKLNPNRYLQSASAKERLFVWYKTVELIKDRPVLGYGIGNWKIFFPSKSVAGSYRLQHKDMIFTRVHNDFLEIWAEQGIFGILLFLGILGWAFYALIFAMRKAKVERKRELIILAGTLLGYVAIAFLDFPKERFEHQILLALLFARIVQKTPEVFQNPRFSLPITRPQYLGIIGLMGLLLLPNALLSYRHIKGESHTLKALIAQANNQWPLLEKESKKAYSTSYQLHPGGLSVKWLEGLAHYHQGNFQQANVTFDQAMQQTPYHINLLNDYAGSLVQMEDYQKAVEVYLKTLEINPKFEKAMFNVAFAYARLGNFKEAFKWVNTTQKNPKKKKEFIEAINQLKSKVPKN